MGNVIASNAANDTINVINTINTDVFQNSYTTLTQQQIIDIQSSGDININNSTLNLSQYANLNTSTLSTSYTSGSVFNQLSQSATQTAETINQSFNLNPGTTESQNVANLTSNVANVVNNSYTQNCAASIIQAQSINLNTINGGNVNVSNTIINLNEASTAYNDCVQKVIGNTDLSTQISQQVSQSAKSTVQNTWGSLLLIIILVMICLGFFLFAGIIKIIIVVLLCVGIYFLIAFLAKLWPFAKYGGTPSDLITTFAITSSVYASNTSAPTVGVPLASCPTSNATDGTQYQCVNYISTPTIIFTYDAHNISNIKTVSLMRDGVFISQKTTNTGTITVPSANGNHNYLIQIKENGIYGKTYNSYIIKTYETGPATLTIVSPTPGSTTSGGTLVNCSSCTNVKGTNGGGFVATVSFLTTPTTTYQVYTKIVSQSVNSGCSNTVVQDSAKIFITNSGTYTMPYITSCGGNNLNTLPAGSYNITTILLDSSNNTVSQSPSSSFTIV